MTCWCPRAVVALPRLDFPHVTARLPQLSFVLGYASQETLHDVILAFSRDPWVLRHCEVDLHDLVPTGDEAREDEGALWNGRQGSCCPPCGVQVRLAQ